MALEEKEQARGWKAGALLDDKIRHVAWPLHHLLPGTGVIWLGFC